MIKKGYKNDGSQAVPLERVSKPRVPVTIHFLQRWVAACSGGSLRREFTLRLYQIWLLPASSRTWNFIVKCGLKFTVGHRAEFFQMEEKGIDF